MILIMEELDMFIRHSPSPVNRQSNLGAGIWRQALARVWEEMTEDHHTKFVRLAWQASATRIRERIRAELAGSLTIAAFLDREATLDFGTRFWSRARQTGREQRFSILDVLANLQRTDAYASPILWLHAETSDAGAIVTQLSELVRYINATPDRLGQELLFADEQLTVGVCFEVDECETFLSWWVA